MLGQYARAEISAKALVGSNILILKLGLWGLTASPSGGGRVVGERAGAIVQAPTPLRARAGGRRGWSAPPARNPTTTAYFMPRTPRPLSRPFISLALFQIQPQHLSSHTLINPSSTASLSAPSPPDMKLVTATLAALALAAAPAFAAPLPAAPAASTMSYDSSLLRVGIDVGLLGKRSDNAHAERDGMYHLGESEFESERY